MAKPPDPFAGAKLSEQVGLDQRLFQSPPGSSPSQLPDERPAVRKDEWTSGHPNVRKAEGPSERPAAGTEDGTSRRPDVSTRPKQPSKGGTKGRRSLSKHAPRIEVAARVVEHRPYNFYQDQVRWLNRKKVEFEEDYGKRVTATSMVQLAVDFLIADYEAKGDDSQLFRVLIKNERPSVRPFGGPAERPEGPSEEASDG